MQKSLPKSLTLNKYFDVGGYVQKKADNCSAFTKKKLNHNITKVERNKKIKLDEGRRNASSYGVRPVFTSMLNAERRRRRWFVKNIIAIQKALNIFITGLHGLSSLYRTL